MKLAVIGGDGIGPEVTAEALKVLRTVRSDIETTDYDLARGATCVTWPACASTMPFCWVPLVHQVRFHRASWNAACY